MSRTTHVFRNGFVVLAEEMPWSESASLMLLVPCGSNHDPRFLPGLANLTCEMVLRGTENLDHRALNDAFENLGAERSESLSPTHTSYSVQMLSEHLFRALELTAHLVRTPKLASRELRPVKRLISQDIIALDDDPVQNMLTELYRNFFPRPWGEPYFGTLEGVRRCTLRDVRNFHRRHYQNDGAILSVAGRFETRRLLERVESLFADRRPRAARNVAQQPCGPAYRHIPCESAQTQIGLAFPAPPFRHPDHAAARSGIDVLCGVGGRLFRELREKRGLAYAVSTSYSSLHNFGCVVSCCGTTPAKAQQSLEVLHGEIEKLRDGITEEELRRVKIRARYSLVMQQESSAARCAVNARDWHRFGRLRSRKEIETEIFEMTTGHIDAYFRDHPPGPFHLVVLGPEELRVTALEHRMELENRGGTCNAGR